MANLRKIARRTFLIGSAAIAGGVAFGVYAYRTPHTNPLLADLPEGAAALTPYVLIDATGITLITPRTDKGQGAYSIQAALIAEELDVELDQIRLDPGPPAPAYWNTAFSGEAAAFLVPGDGTMNRITHGVLDAVIKFSGMQVTGGSTTVPDGFVKLRKAGAVARETLKAAAAARSGVDIAALKTEAGAVILPDGTAIPYTELATEAARIDLPDDVPLRAAGDWRLIGKPMARVDIPDKSTGRAQYGIDHRPEGVLHAAVLLNPAQGGEMLARDAERARGMRGVRSVVPITGGLGIIADNTWRAFQAAEAVETTWGPAPFPATMEAHWAALKAAFDPNTLDSRKRDDGDVDSALGGDVIEAEYRAPYVAHAPLEPINATVLVKDGRVDVWTGTQIPRFVQTNVAAITGVDSENVHVHQMLIGGSFGHRLEDDVVRHAAEIAMTMQGTPIHLTYRRETDMAHDYPRQIAMARMRGTVADGQVQALDLGIAMPSVIASQMARQGQTVPGPDSQIVAGAWDQPFGLPHQRVTGYRAPELAPISSWRSVGASTNGFFYNRALDALIRAAGADPLEERLRLCTDPLARRVLEAVGEMSDWAGSDIGAGRGRGIALTQSFGVHCAEVIDVTATDAGLRIDDVFVAAEVGTVVDPVNFEAQVSGGVVWALGHAMNCEITYTDGIADQQNYFDHAGMRLHQCPVIHVRGLENGDAVRGIGEPTVPPAAPALAAAIEAATGVDLREMPFSRSVDFA